MGKFQIPSRRPEVAELAALRRELAEVKSELAALKSEHNCLVDRVAQFPTPPRPGWIRVSGMASEPAPLEQVPFPPAQNTALEQLARIINFPVTPSPELAHV